MTGGIDAPARISKDNKNFYYYKEERQNQI
jgi:hypothetical protein